MQRNGSRSARVLAVAIVASATLVAVPAVGVQPAWAANSPNLVKNGTADNGKGGTGGVVPVPSWTESTGTSFTAVKYGSAPDFPGPMSPGPQKRGPNFLAGGPSMDSEVALQTDSLKAYSTAIKSGSVGFQLKAFLGGSGTLMNQALIEIDFKDKNGFLISDATLPAVSPSDRHFITGLIQRRTTGMVPTNAKSVQVQVSFEYFEGTYNTAFADSIQLTLRGV